MNSIFVNSEEFFDEEKNTTAKMVRAELTEKDQEIAFHFLLHTEDVLYWLKEIKNDVAVK